MRGRSTSLPRLSTSRRPRSGGSHVAPCLSRTSETASGAGRLVVYGVSIEVVVRGFDAIVPIAAAFADGVPFMLLGRADFFRAFRVVFDERAQTLTLDEYDDGAPLAFAA